MRKSKQIKIDTIQELSAKYGTIDKKSPDVLFIRAKGRIIPTVKKVDYSKDIVELKQNFNNIVKDKIMLHKNDINCERYICNIDISEKGISYKKGSYIKYDIFVKPKNKKDVFDYKDELTSLLTNINDDLKEKMSLLNLKYINKSRQKELNNEDFSIT